MCGGRVDEGLDVLLYEYDGGQTTESGGGLHSLLRTDDIGLCVCIALVGIVGLLDDAHLSGAEESVAGPDLRRTETHVLAVPEANAVVGLVLLGFVYPRFFVDYFDSHAHIMVALADSARINHLSDATTVLASSLLA